jgi:wyosine [tRNA(Phe)-imidazoG37] synthetase (radical SAM superfamily)
VAQAVQSACTSSLDFDYLTFSGNGEPALHPDFPRIARDVADIRNRYRPRVRIALLSNSTGFAHPEVQDTLAVIDVPVLKLDAGTEHKFEEINRPAPEVSYQRLIEIMQRLEGIRLQTTFVDGPTSNTADLDLAAYFARVREIGPVEVHIYSTDRPVPNSQLALVPPERLREIAERGERETGVAFKAFYL